MLCRCPSANSNLSEISLIASHWVQPECDCLICTCSYGTLKMAHLMSHQIHNRSAAPPNLSVVRWFLCTCRPPEVLSIECRSVSLRRVKTLHKLYAEILIYYASTIHLQSLLSQYVTLFFVWLFEALIQLVLYDFELVSFDKKFYIYGTSPTFHQFKLLQLLLLHQKTNTLRQFDNRL